MNCLQPWGYVQKCVVLHFFITLLLSVLFVSCSPEDHSAELKIAGSSTVLPVVSKAAEQYVNNHPDVRIVVNAGGSGTGINLLGEGQIDVCMSSRDLAREERDQYPGVTFVQHTIGLDAVVPVVSEEVYASGVHALSRAEIAKIYRGEITNWSDVGGLNREIFVVDKERSRGTRHVFMTFLFDNSRASAPGADIVLGANNEEQNAIANSDAAIGMLSRPWVNKKVRSLGIKQADGSILRPTSERIRDSTYPITRELRVCTDGEPEGRIQSFLQFIRSNTGQNIVQDAGYVRVDK